MIAFRVDANQYTATGHAMRCMSIADAVLARGDEAVFIAADEESGAFIASRGHRVIVLHTDWEDMDGELPNLLPVLEQVQPDWLIISSYQTTKTYFEAVTERVKTLYVDDLNEYAYPVTALLNYNIYAERMNYRELYAETETKLYLGPSFAPLRRQFRQILPPLRDRVEHILLSTGGADSCGVAQALVHAAAKNKMLSQMYFHVIRGHFASDIAVPKQMGGHVVIHRDVSDMASLMCSCDVAITAGGSTTYELCACGVPTVSYSISDDQIIGAGEFARRGLIPYCGDMRGDPDACIRALLMHVEQLTMDKTMRRSVSERLRRVVDGDGAERIVRSMYAQ